MAQPVEFGPWPRLGYVGSLLDRAADRRGDAAFLDAALRNPRSSAVAIGGELIVLRQNLGANPLLAVSEALSLGAAGEPVLLGVNQDAGVFAVGITAEKATALQADGKLFVGDLRSLAMRGQVAPEVLQPIATAKALLTWHARHGFCANCGAPTRVTEAGWRRDCPACGVQHFPRTDPCVIMLAIDGERCLLGRAPRFPPEMWSCLAGFIEPGETIEEAVRREIREEAGIGVGQVTYLGSQPWPFPMSLMIGCFGEATSTALQIDRNEVEDARWVSREEVGLMLKRQHPNGLFTPPPMAIAHHILRAYVERGADVLRGG
ncbi:MAG: NAD(+) diphosphatase [Bradyrhizobiaceae bacterium]|nr:NAD(+) diphosphatase [Bradyrhizobiaceae bacterium]